MDSIEIITPDTVFVLTIHPVPDTYLDWYRWVLKDKNNGATYEGFKSIEDLIDFVAKR